MKLRLLDDHTTSKNDAYKSSPHTYFEQASELAKKGALVNTDDREFQCFSMALKHDKIPAYKEALRQFRSKLSELSDDDTNEFDCVYQINLQFFPLTKLPEKFKKSGNKNGITFLDDAPSFT